MIALADMPYIKTVTIEQLATRLAAGADIIAPRYQQQRGHPVGFQQRHRDALMSLDGDVGARKIIEAHQDRLELLDTNVTHDIRGIVFCTL